VRGAFQGGNQEGQGGGRASESPADGSDPGEAGYVEDAEKRRAEPVRGRARQLSEIRGRDVGLHRGEYRPANRPLDEPMRTRLTLSLLALFAGGAFAQGRGGGRGGPPPPPRTGKEAALYDLTGYWVSVVTE